MDLVQVVVNESAGTIEDNLDAVEQSIRERMQEYATVVITEDTVGDGKKLLADIRKEKKVLDDKRKEVKRRWLEPYEAFEKRIKAIEGCYASAEGEISAQLDIFEGQRREAKRQRIEEIYNEVKGELEEWVPLERIYDKRWENATCTDAKIREDMTLAFGQMELSISTIKSMLSEFEADALYTLMDTGSLKDALEKIADLNKQKARFATAAQEPENVAQEPENAVQELKNGAQEAESVADGMCTVKVKVDEGSFNLLIDFLTSMGLEYEVI